MKSWMLIILYPTNIKLDWLLLKLRECSIQYLNNKKKLFYEQKLVTTIFDASYSKDVNNTNVARCKNIKSRSIIDELSALVTWNIISDYLLQFKWYLIHNVQC